MLRDGGVGLDCGFIINTYGSVIERCAELGRFDMISVIAEEISNG